MFARLGYFNSLARWLFIILPALSLGTLCTETYAHTISSSEEVLDLSKQSIKVNAFNIGEMPLYPEKRLSRSVIEEFLHSYLIQNSKQGALTINQLHSAADELTRRYRNASYLFHRAYTPQQKINNKQVKIDVMKGKLSSIHNHNQKNNSANQLISFFDELIGLPIETDSIEAALLKVNTLPGLQVFAYFSAGAQENETRLNLRVIKEHSFFSQISLDNYGTKTTGLHHLNLNSGWINPLGDSDSLQFGLSQIYQPENSLYGYIQYRMSLFNNNNDVYFSYSNNNYELGKSNNYRIGTDYNLISNSQHLLSINIEHYKHVSNITSKFSDQLHTNTKLERWQLALNHSIKQAKFWSHGELGIRHTIQEENTSSANNPLSPVDKLLLTGPSKVRGIKSGYLSVDKGSLLHAELSWNNTDLKLFLFTDTALGTKIATATNSQSPQYTQASAGIGLSWRLLKNWSVKIQTAHVLIAEQALKNKSYITSYLLSLARAIHQY